MYQMIANGFDISLPATHASGVVFSSPHSGRHYPEEFVQASRLDRQALRASEDVLVDELFAGAPAAGAPLIAARLPRAWLDLNRSPRELDPALVDGISAHGLNQRVAAGLGVVPRVVAEGAAIYDGKISLAEAEARIAGFHVPYHEALDELLRAARGRTGRALLYDCHSMPAEALRAAPRIRGRSPDIVLGDRFGASAHRSTVAETQEAFERAGFVVGRNTPFAGGYITQRYGRPARGIEAVQIEINRALYLDAARLEPLPSFGALRERIDSVIRDLIKAMPAPGTLAAE
ncbi:MAG: N-formylglutamate amidohydrolase [Pseudomonadota bacterium]